MSNIHLDINADCMNVIVNGEYIGNIVHSSSPYHNLHCYLKLQLQDYDVGIAKDLFDLIMHNQHKPLQIMLSSTEPEMISFIQAAGFCLKRKCYETEASIQEYIGCKDPKSLSCALKGHPIYETCCNIMLERYIATHKEISLWTGTKEDFFRMMPDVLFYEMDHDEIKNFAFVEDHEIAYVYGSNINGFAAFAQALIAQMFVHHHTIVFEADDCDEYALELKKLFVNQTNESFDTFILK